MDLLAELAEHELFREAHCHEADRLKSRVLERGPATTIRRSRAVLGRLRPRLVCDETGADALKLACIPF